MAHIEVFKGWADTIRHDVEAFKTLLDSASADNSSRKIAGAALSYLVSRMDLIPDWNEGIGVIDDIMVLRVCAQLTQTHARGALPPATETALVRLAKEAEQIKEFLGAPLYDNLSAYCAKLVDQKVRNRTVAEIVEDETVRKALFTEVEEEVKTTGPMVINDPVDAELRLKAYLTHKLQS